MLRQRVIEVGSIIWAFVGAAVALTSLPSVNADAKLIVGIASIVFPLAAVAAAVALRARRVRAAGALLLVSVATPTYFAYALNVPALLVGGTLLAAPALLVADHKQQVERTT